MSAMPESNQSNYSAPMSLADAIQTGIAAATLNIQSAQRRVNCDDLTARFFDNAVSSLEIMGAQLIDISNAEVDSYNELAEALENAELRLGIKQSELNDVQAQLNKQLLDQQEAIANATYASEQRAAAAESQLSGLENKVLESAAMITLRNEQIETLNKSFKEIMKLDPHGLNKRCKTAQDERNEARKTVQDLSGRLKKSERELSTTRVGYAQQKAEATRLAGELTRFETLQKEMFGISEKRLVSAVPHPEHGLLTYTPRIIAYGIVADKKSNSERPYIVSGLNFAFQICCDMGYALDIRINEWLMPNIQPMDIFTSYQPEGWVEFFHELIMAETESRRPELVRRVEWAKETMIADLNLPITEDLADYLSDRGLFSLFDVVHFRKNGLVSVHSLQPDDAQRLLDLCYAEVNAWEKRQEGNFYVR